MTRRQDVPPLESERPRVVTEPRILTPTLVVLLGSTPALASLELMRQMQSLNVTDKSKVAFVYIDTDDVPPSLVEFRQQHNGVFQEYSLRIAVPGGVSNAQRVEQGQRGQRTEQYTFIRDKTPQFFANGAGGIRNNGHVAACFNYSHIENTLHRALTAITQVGTHQGATQAREIQVNIVAFLGGGTGSGIAADIAVTVRQLLLKFPDCQQRINLFCMLPEPIRGANVTDLSWRKSNSTAALLEILALSLAAGNEPSGIYQKFMRGNSLQVTHDPIANEVYLVGHAAMGEAGDTARIVGLDLFQRITDASGVGFLEHSKWVDRRTLGERDDRGLPTLFGTSCPLEVRFDAHEAALAFAQISAARLLPILGSYTPSQVNISDDQRLTWASEWKNVARFDANRNDPLAVPPPQEFPQDEFIGAVRGQLDILWARVGKIEKELEDRIRAVVAIKRLEEVKNIEEPPRADSSGQGMIDRQIRHLHVLREEYKQALEELKAKKQPAVPGRPVDLESELLQPPSMFVNMMKPLRESAEQRRSAAVCDAYNDRVLKFARATRRQLVEELVVALFNRVEEALSTALRWAKSADASATAAELEETGQASMAWHGQLEHPHPHQRHIFDLRTLHMQTGRNIAMEQLYRWATAKKDMLSDDGAPLDYTGFVAPCLDYISHKSAQNGNGLDDSHPLEIGPSRIAARIVDYFRDYYLSNFQDTNLFEMLDKTVPPPPTGISRRQHISNYLLEHLQHVKGLMRTLIAFEAELSPQGASTLDTSVYLGIHWRDGAQKAIIDQALHDLGSVTNRNQGPMAYPAIDPHRLQVAYGQHAFSLSMVRDFYLDQSSAMADYLHHQENWARSDGKGSMPVHSSGEMERLVADHHSLPFRDLNGQVVSVALPLRIVRAPFRL